MWPLHRDMLLTPWMEKDWDYCVCKKVELNDQMSCPALLLVSNG